MYRTRLTNEPALEAWKPRMPATILRVWRSKKFRYHASAVGFSLSFNIGAYLGIGALIGGSVLPTPWPDFFRIGMALVSLICIPIAILCWRAEPIWPQD